VSHSTRNSDSTPSSASAAESERERDQHVVEPRRRHHLRLAELLAGDAGRAGANLRVCEHRQLVRLDVRPEREAVAVAVRLHPRDVPVDRVEVDRERRRVELLERHRATIPR
jgi:hypothetical protein